MESRIFICRQQLRLFASKRRLRYHMMVSCYSSTRLLTWRVHALTSHVDCSPDASLLHALICFFLADMLRYGARYFSN